VVINRPSCDENFDCAADSTPVSVPAMGLAS
jgi:hypothetical protein